MSRGIKVTKVDNSMHKPEYKDLVSGTVFMIKDDLFIKVVLQHNDHTYAIRLDNGYSYDIAANEAVTVVELHCEVVKTNPYHYTVKPKAKPEKPITKEEDEEE